MKHKKIIIIITGIIICLGGGYFLISSNNKNKIMRRLREYHLPSKMIINSLIKRSEFYDDKYNFLYNIVRYEKKRRDGHFLNIRLDIIKPDGDKCTAIKKEKEGWTNCGTDMVNLINTRILVHGAFTVPFYNLSLKRELQSHKDKNYIYTTNISLPFLNHQKKVEVKPIKTVIYFNSNTFNCRKIELFDTSLNNKKIMELFPTLSEVHQGIRFYTKIKVNTYFENKKVSLIIYFKDIKINPPLEEALFNPPPDAIKIR